MNKGKKMALREHRHKQTLAEDRRKAEKKTPQRNNLILEFLSGYLISGCRQPSDLSFALSEYAFGIKE